MSSRRLSSEEDARYHGWLQSEGHQDECSCTDCSCLREGWHFWNDSLDGADAAAGHGVPIRGRDGWVLPPGWEGRVDDSTTDPDLPKWIRIGRKLQGYNFELVHNRPVVYRCVRSSDDKWSRPNTNDVLWLFRKYDQWVAGHADKETGQIQDVLDEAHLVWSTEAQLPWIEGYYDWRWVDNDRSKEAQEVIAPWFCGTFGTHELS